MSSRNASVSRNRIISALPVKSEDFHTVRVRTDKSRVDSDRFLPPRNSMGREVARPTRAIVSGSKLLVNNPIPSIVNVIWVKKTTVADIRTTDPEPSLFTILPPITKEDRKMMREIVKNCVNPSQNISPELNVKY